MEYIFRVAKSSLGSKKMSDFMYALIYTGAKLTDSSSLSIRNYSRKQICRGYFTAIIKIRKDRLHEFENLTGITTTEPPKICTT